jgi:hypothetical protein
MDEMTGVQALERLFPDLPMQAGHVLRREFEYLRHGTLIGADFRKNGEKRDEREPCMRK